MKYLNLEFIVEWSATLILLLGVWLTSFNYYPINVFVCLVANLLWLWLGFIWKKWSLIIVELVVVVIYLIGSVKALI
jgi:hypothetical protein